MIPSRTDRYLRNSMWIFVVLLILHAHPASADLVRLHVTGTWERAGSAQNDPLNLHGANVSYLYTYDDAQVAVDRPFEPPDPGFCIGELSFSCIYEASGSIRTTNRPAGAPDLVHPFVADAAVSIGFRVDVVVDPGGRTSSDVNIATFQLGWPRALLGSPHRETFSSVFWINTLPSSQNVKYKEIWERDDFFRSTVDFSVPGLFNSNHQQRYELTNVVWGATVVPVPPALFMFVCGVIALRRRRRRADT